MAEILYFCSAMTHGAAALFAVGAALFAALAVWRATLIANETSPERAMELRYQVAAAGLWALAFAISLAALAASF